MLGFILYVLPSRTYSEELCQAIVGKKIVQQHLQVLTVKQKNINTKVRITKQTVPTVVSFIYLVKYCVFFINKCFKYVKKKGSKRVDDGYTVITYSPSPSFVLYGAKRKIDSRVFHLRLLRHRMFPILLRFI